MYTTIRKPSRKRVFVRAFVKTKSTFSFPFYTRAYEKCVFARVSELLYKLLYNCCIIVV